MNLKYILIAFIVFLHLHASQAQRWSHSLAASWAGNSNTEIFIRAFAKDASGNQYIYFESASPQSTFVRVGLDTAAFDKGLVKLSPANRIIWRLNLKQVASTFTVSQMTVHRNGSVFLAGVAGPGSFKDTTISANNVMENKALFLPSVGGRIDTVKLKKRLPNSAGFANSPILVKYNADGQFENFYTPVGGQNNDQSYDLFLKGDTLYQLYKSHEIQGCALLNANNFQVIADSRIGSAWQRASFFGKAAWLPGSKRLFTAIGYGGTINTGQVILTGGSQGYIVELDPNTGRVLPSYKKLNNPQFNNFRNKANNLVAPQVNAINENSFYFTFYCLRDSLPGASLSLDGQTITKQAGVATTPLYGIAIATLESDTIRFTTLNKIEAQSNNISSFELSSRVDKVGDLYTAAFAFQNNSGGASGIKISGNDNIIGTEVRAKLIRTNPEGNMTYLLGSTGGANVPTNAQVFVDDSNHVYISGRYYGNASSSFTFTPFVLPNPRGAFVVKYTEATTKLASKELAGVNVYPNPSTGQVHINHPIGAALFVFGLNGQEILHHKTSGISHSTLYLNPGVYRLRIDYEGKSTTKKLSVF